MMNFHAHIYFVPEFKPNVLELVNKVLELDLPDLELFKVYDNKVGPHFLPMAEMHFSSSNVKAVLECLNAHHGGLSVLVHVDSGDDYKDHENPIWIGKPLPIDFDFFDRVKADASLSVH